MGIKQVKIAQILFLQNSTIFLEKKNAPQIFVSLWLISKILKSLILTIFVSALIVFMEQHVFRGLESTIPEALLLPFSVNHTYWRSQGRAGPEETAQLKKISRI